MHKREKAHSDTNRKHDWTTMLTKEEENAIEMLLQWMAERNAYNFEIITFFVLLDYPFCVRWAEHLFVCSSVFVIINCW